MKRKKRSLLATLLISYAIVLAIPLAVIVLFYYPYTNAIIIQKETNWNSYITEQMASRMDAFMDYATKIPAQLLLNRDIMLTLGDDDEYLKTIVAGEMRKYANSDPFIFEAFLHVKNYDYVFSRHGYAYRMEDFNTSVSAYRYPAWSHEGMTDTLNELGKKEVRPAEEVIVPTNNAVRMVTFLYPLRPGIRKSYGSVLILVPENEIVRSLKSVSSNYQGDFAIVDEKGRTIVRLDAAPELDPLAVERDVNVNGNGGPWAGTREVGGKRAIISCAISERYGWKYVSAVPLERPLKESRDAQLMTLFMFALILVTGSLLIVVSIKMNYGPISELTAMARDSLDGRGAHGGNEIDLIRSALDDLIHENARINERFARSLPQIREGLLVPLINGAYRSAEEFERDAAPFGLRLRFPNYAAALVAVEQRSDELLSILESEEEFAPEGIDIWFLRSPYSRDCLCFAAHGGDARPADFLENIRKIVEKKLETRAVVGLGTSYRTMARIHTSYLQALRCVDALRFRGTATTLRFADIESTGYEDAYPQDLLDDLERFSMQEQPACIRTVAEKLGRYIAEGRRTAESARSVYGRAISILIEGLRRQPQEGNSLTMVTTLAFAEHSSAEDNADILNETAATLAAIIERRTHEGIRPTIEMITEHIGASFHDKDFTLKRAACHFGMSASNFSHYFKRATGRNFKDYVEELRIGRAKELLRAKKLTLEKVAEKSGYSGENISSFIRAFKNYVGMPPGRFRDLDTTTPD